MISKESAIIELGCVRLTYSSNPTGANALAIGTSQNVPYTRQDVNNSKCLGNVFAERQTKYATRKRGISNHTVSPSSFLVMTKMIHVTMFEQVFDFFRKRIICCYKWKRRV